MWYLSRRGGWERDRDGDGEPYRSICRRAACSCVAEKPCRSRPCRKDSLTEILDTHNGSALELWGIKLDRVQFVVTVGDGEICVRSTDFDA